MRKSCSCGNAWADEPGHDYDQEDTTEDERELTAPRVVTWAGQNTAPLGRPLTEAERRAFKS